MDVGVIRWFQGRDKICRLSFVSALNIMNESVIRDERSNKRFPPSHEVSINGKKRFTFRYFQIVSAKPFI